MAKEKFEQFHDEVGTEDLQRTDQQWRIQREKKRYAALKIIFGLASAFLLIIFGVFLSVTFESPQNYIAKHSDKLHMQIRSRDGHFDFLIPVKSETLEAKTAKTLGVVYPHFALWCQNSIRPNFHILYVADDTLEITFLSMKLGNLLSKAKNGVLHILTKSKQFQDLVNENLKYYPNSDHYPISFTTNEFISYDLIILENNSPLPTLSPENIAQSDIVFLKQQPKIQLFNATHKFYSITTGKTHTHIPGSGLFQYAIEPYQTEEPFALLSSLSRNSTYPICQKTPIIYELEVNVKEQLLQLIQYFRKSTDLNVEISVKQAALPIMLYKFIPERNIYISSQGPTKEQFCNYMPSSFQIQQLPPTKRNQTIIIQEFQNYKKDPSYNISIVRLTNQQQCDYFAEMKPDVLNGKLAYACLITAQLKPLQRCNVPLFVVVKK